MSRELRCNRNLSFCQMVTMRLRGYQLFGLGSVQSLHRIKMIF